MRPARVLAAPDAGGWIPGIAHRHSPHCDLRPPGVAVDAVVVHHISLPPGHFRGDAIDRLFLGTLNPDAHPDFAALRGVRVSAHFVIRRHGMLLQYVATTARAWHAGVSSLDGRSACNDFSIGIELEGDLLRPFTAAQYRTLDRLLPALAQSHPLRWVTGHSDIAPGRKTDPGPHFAWSRLEPVLVRCGMRRWPATAG